LTAFPEESSHTCSKGCTSTPSIEGQSTILGHRLQNAVTFIRYGNSINGTSLLGPPEYRVDCASCILAEQVKIKSVQVVPASRCAHKLEQLGALG
jgi:hypothetical protein